MAGSLWRVNAPDADVPQLQHITVTDGPCAGGNGVLRASDHHQSP
jgi:hypothetical protein